MAGIYVSRRRQFQTVDYGPPDYEQKVLAVLQQLEGDPPGNPVSKLIIQAINDTGKIVRIVPHDALEPGYVCGAGTRATNDQKGSPAGLVVGKNDPDPRKTWYTGRVDDPSTPGIDERFTPVAATFNPPIGGGSGAIVGFTHGDWASAASCATEKGGPYGAMPDEKLLHELVHALRITQGLFNAVPTVNKDYGTEEEFLAITVVNVYMSFKYGIVAQLRYGHKGNRPLLYPLNTSEGFVDDPDNFRVLSHYHFPWSSVFMSLAQVHTAAFNPFLEYFRRFVWPARKPKPVDRSNSMDQDWLPRRGPGRF